MSIIFKKKKQTHKEREQTRNYQGGGGGGNIGVRVYEVLTMRYKTSDKEIRYNVGNTANILQ